MNPYVKGLLITTLGVLFIVPDALFARLIEAPVLTIAFWRAFMAGNAVLLWMLFIHRSQTFSKIKATGKLGLLYAVLMGASSIVFVTAVNMTSVANVVFIIASMPAVAALMGRYVLGEYIDRRTAITIGLVLVGVAIIAFGPGGGHGGHGGEAGQINDWRGNMVAMLNPILFAAGLTTVRKAKARSMVPATVIMFYGTAFILFFITDVTAVRWEQWPLLVMYGGLFMSASTVLLAIGPRYLSGPEVSLLMLLETILAPLLIWGVIGEYPGVSTFVGGAIVIGVLLISNLLVLLRFNSVYRAAAKTVAAE